MASPSPVLLTLSGDPLIEEARQRFDRTAEFEAIWRTRFINDLKFANGDSDNGYQWPDALRRARGVGDKPCLTMNIVRQHNLQIVNEAKRNKSEPKVIPLGNGATVESAEVVRALIRHVGHQSNAQAARTTAREFQVEGGIGWWRIVTDYEGPDSFDQEIFIRPVPDPLSIYMDPDCQQKDCSDAKFAFVFDVVLQDDFRAAYPDLELPGPTPLGLGSMDADWIAEDHIRVCEYFRKVPKADKLVSFVHQGQRKTIRHSRLPVQGRKAILDDPQTRIRSVFDDEVEWYLIAGQTVVDSTIWPGRWIPLIRCIGEETMIDGLLDRKGHTRAMKDSQRMFNYNSSAQVEFVALQGKTPWVGPAKAIEGYETYWNTANNQNHSILPYNDTDDENPERQIAAPTRTEPPTAAPAYQAGMETAFNQMMMTSGQWQNQMGMGGNERTGRAIAERQEQSDTSVFHFQDNFEDSLRYEARQLIDLFPKVYDTKRVKKILADDGVSMEVVIDPSSKQAYLAEQQHDNEVIRRIFNPTLGLYDIAPSFGPAYGSRRKETADALTLILTQAPGLTGIIGDLLLRSLDFEEAQEAALRLKRMVPPIALGQGPSQSEQQLQAQVQHLTGLLTKVLQDHAKDRLKLIGKGEMRDIDAYKAETDRFKALADALMLDEGGMNQVVEQLVSDALQTKLQPILEANAPELEAESGSPAKTGGIPAGTLDQPPVPGAQRAQDGEWYILDPTRRGKYLRVAPLAQERPGPRTQLNGASGG